MPTLMVEPAETLADYARLISALGNGMKWYRGVGSSGYGLVPSLYRHPSITAGPDLLAIEKQLLTRFRERAQPMVSRPLPDDPLELLFLMQHHGMPTRLLDWSENAFVSLFFALSTAMDTAPADGSPWASCVWVLKPISWNKTVQSHISYSGEPFSVGDDRLTNGYVEVGNGAGLMQNPVAVYGVHNSPRIVSQRGVFTLFGGSTQPMEQIFATGSFDQDALVKIEIRGEKQSELFEELKNAGVLDSTVFPDLDGLSRELRRGFGYKI